MRHLIAEKWRAFEAKVTTPRTSDAMRRSLQFAFYAGAEAVERAAEQMLEGPASEESQHTLTDLRAELDEFVMEVKDGR